MVGVVVVVEQDSVSEVPVETEVVISLLVGVAGVMVVMVVMVMVVSVPTDETVVDEVSVEAVDEVSVETVDEVSVERVVVVVD